MVPHGAVEGQVAQAGGAGGADAVLDRGPLPVAQFEAGTLRTAWWMASVMAIPPSSAGPASPDAQPSFLRIFTEVVS